MPKKKIVTKKQVAQPITPEILKKILFTKDDARESEVKLNERLGGMERRLGGMESKMATKEDLQILTVKVQNIENKIDEMATRKEVTDIFGRYIEVHQKDHTQLEERVSKLETAAFTSS